VAFCALIAVLLRHGFRRLGERGAAPLALRRVGVGLLAFIHVVAAPLVALALTQSTAAMARGLEAVAGEVASAAAPGDRVVLLAASDPMVTMYPPFVLLDQSPAWARSCWSVASGAKASHVVTRTGPRTLAIEPRGGEWMAGAFERLFRSADEPFHVGDEVAQCGITYRVAAMDGPRLTRVDLTLDTPLDDRGVRFVAWQDGHLRPVAVPAPGTSTTLTWSPGPTGIF
jgi:hypothetical protein